MSKVLLVSYRNKKVPPKVKDCVQKIEKAILPDNLAPNPMDLKINNGTISCIFNPVDLKQRQGNSLCLGVAENNWWETSNDNKVLEGSYAVFRENEQHIELQTDAVASRTIWYFVDDEKILASNSQLAIIYYLGDFEFNEDVIPWMLSSGTLGPYLSWDSRIEFLKPQSTLKLSRDTWKFKVDHQPIIFSENKDESIDTVKYLEKLTSEVDFSTKCLPFDRNLLLPLSGGYDSRGILLSLMKNKIKPPSITWGSRDAIKQQGNDAYVAKKLAEHYNLNHTYEHTEDSRIDVRTVINRFIINSEGRTDNIGGYMDGFQIWKTIFENDYTAIIRGDEGFGWVSVYSEQQARKSVGINLVNDSDKLKDLGYKQLLPEELKKEIDESLEGWRDRIYHSFRLPIILGALNETKSSYVEIVNPLLNYSILKLVRSLPDDLRDDKKLFRMYVDKHSSNIPYASKVANIDYRKQLSKKEVVDYFIDTIKKQSCKLIEDDFIDSLIEDITKKKNKKIKDNLFTMLKNITPEFLKSYLRGRVKNINIIDNNLLLFRVFIIYKMNMQINNTLNNIKR